MSQQPYEYNDWSQVRFPPLYEEPSSSSGPDRNLGNFDPVDINYRTYTDRSRPILVRPRMWDDNGFYINGPTWQAWSHAQSQFNQIQALTQSWSDPNRMATIQNFGSYLSQYGNTNSPGVLWGIAQMGVDPESDVVQELLKIDAEEVQKDNRQTQPVRAGSPVANEGIEEEGDFWEPLQFVSRNAFSVLSSGMEAVQGAARMIGGAFANEEMTPGERAAQVIGANVGLVLGPLSGGLELTDEDGRSENPFGNPWAQTDFGQTLILARKIGFDAFTSGQAGLDVNKAKEELGATDPNFAQLPPDQQNAVAEQYAQDREYYSQPGWFIDETSLVGEMQRRKTFNTWAIPGPDDEMTAWTFGRGIASATVGADSEAYGTMSGFIDAVAAIATDPLTYVPAIGIPSKLIMAGTRGAWKIGKAGDEWRGVIRRMNEAAAKARELSDAGDTEAARRIATEELREYLGQPPTQQQIDDVVNGITFTSDPADFKNMGLDDIAEITQAGREAELTSIAFKAATPDKDTLYTYVKSARRSILEAETTQRFIDQSVLPTGGTNDFGRMADMWDDFIRYGDENPGVTPADFMLERFGIDPRMDVPPQSLDDVAQQNFEGMAQFNELFEMWRTFAVGTGRPLTETLPEFSAVLRRAGDDTRSVRVAPPIAQERLDSDTGRLLIDSTAEQRLEELENLDYAGIVVDRLPTDNLPALGAYGPNGGIFYLNPVGKQKPNFVDGDEIIPDDVREQVLSQLRTIAEREDMRLSNIEVADVVFDTLPGQVYRQIEAATDARGFMDELMGNSNLTYNRLLSASALVGFDGALYDILRTGIPKNRIDGITNIDGVPGRTWLGDSPDISGYGISNEMRQAAAQVRDLDDPIAELDNLGIAARTTTVLGFDALTPAELDAYRESVRQAGMRSRELLSEERSNSLFNAYRQQEQLRTQIDSLNAEWVDPVAKLKSVVGWHSGMRHHPVNGYTLDEKGVRAFLFGMGPLSGMGNRALNVLSDFVPENLKTEALEAGKGSERYNQIVDRAMGELTLATGTKWSPDLYRAVAENAIDGGGKSGLIDILAPRLGVDVSEGDIAKTIVSRGKDGKRFINSRRTVSPRIARMLGQMPTARKVNLQDSRDVTDNMILYGRYARINEAVLAEQIGRVMRASGTAEEGIAARNALLEVFNEASVQMIRNIEESGVTKTLFRGKDGQRRKKEIINAIINSTRLYFGGEYKAVDGDINELVGLGADMRTIILADGTQFVMPNAKLDSELADGFIGLPGVEEWAAGLRRTTLALDRLPMVGNTADWAMRAYNNFFRTSLLVFRGAYLLRNLAEMQVRMFLNGHASIYNSPATMLAMTIGDEWWGRQLAKYNIKRQDAVNVAKARLAEQGITRKPTKEEIEALAGPAPQMPKLIASFDRYRNTILDTSFNTGLDEQLAATNKVTEFWKLMREAHSLTDPRVYNAGVRQEWVPVEYGSQNFSKGWANELVMLQQSDVARLIVGQPDERQFANLVDGVAGLDVQRKIAQELMYGQKHERLRRRLIASNDEYGKIFASEEATLEYLFRNQNSVFNKILLYTNNDSRLIDYIATGTLRYADGKAIVPMTYVKPNRRISEMRSILDDYFSGDDWANHFRAANGGMGVRVPYIDDMERKEGFGWVNKFFEISTKMERIGAVGPEFRMAYWNRVAELAPSLRAKDVERALKAAETTLSPIQNLSGVRVGRTHPAFVALEKARNNGNDGVFKLDEIHEQAMSYAADEIAELFYDAARRNNFWYAMRVIVPFGQAWGNTLSMWGKLGAKQPLNIYKAQKLFNALQEEQSNAIYEAGQQFGPLSAYGKYEPGYAPWERDAQGGFFYSDQNGDTVFEVPLAGRALGMGTNLLARMNGVDAGPLLDANASVQSPVTSLNLALGGDSLMPGFGPVVAFPLGADIVPDNKYTGMLRQQVSPFGDKQIMENVSAAWLQKAIGGAQAIPLLGDYLSSWTGALYPAMKNRNIADAQTILSTTGNYPDLMTNPETARRFKQDVEELAAATMLMTGLMQNVMPSTPLPQAAARLTTTNGEEQTTSQYTLGLVNSLFQQYQVRNGFDRTAAVEEMIKDFGPSVTFALVGNWSGALRQPTSQAMDWVEESNENAEIAAAYIDIFPMFFPQGDTSDVRARRWLRDNTFTEQQRKSPDEAFSAAVDFLAGAQIARINSMENAGEITADQASQARDAVREQYRPVDEPSGVYFDRTMELNQINDFYNRYEKIQQTEAGKAFGIAWELRNKALMHTRAWTGDEDAGLGSERATPVRNEYFRQLDALVQQYPDFTVLAGRLRKEWE